MNPTLTPTVTLVGAPVVATFTRADPDPSNFATVTFSVTFSKPVSGLTAANFTLTGTATAGAGVGTPTTTDGGTTWTVPVTTGGEGSLGLTLSDRSGIQDADRNPLYNTTADDGTTFTFGELVTGP